MARPAETSPCKRKLPFTVSEQPPLQNRLELLLNNVANARVSSRNAICLFMGHFSPRPKLSEARSSELRPARSGVK